MSASVAFSTQALAAGRRSAAGHHLVDQPGGLRGGGRHHLALEQERGGGHHAEHPDEPGGAAGAGEDADEDLGQSDPRLRVVGHEAAVAGEADLGADAGRGARRRPGDRLAALQRLRVHAGALDLPQQRVQRHRALEEPAGGVGAGLRLHLGEHVQVHAAGEVGLGRGDDDALDGGVGQRRVDGGVELGDAVIGQHVHRAARQVPGEGRHAVGVDVGCEDRHLRSPRVRGGRVARSATTVPSGRR